MNSKIHTREWLAIALILGMILTIGTISWINNRAIRHTHHIVQLALTEEPVIAIAIEGAVENPGVFHFKPGVTLKEVFKRVHLTKNADRRQLNFKKVIYQPEKIQVPSKSRAKRIQRQKKY